MKKRQERGLSLYEVEGELLFERKEGKKKDERAEENMNDLSRGVGWSMDYDDRWEGFKRNKKRGWID